MPSLCTRTLLLIILLCSYLHLTASAEGLELGGVVSALQLHEEGKDRNTINGGGGKVTRKMRMMEKMEAFLMDYSPPGSNPKHGPGHP